ncbi:MAG: hypothetical protein A3H57_02080 [Candidatus Taylorbacteria bacterium RIFCSPLOWO2_02_FULL_43_11]|uniref:Type II secretion system protein GspF domain-containing protein n=1 Tax=Candidatus Taylorbacteria bacterium RIFCSPHIGHO2_02_FULL_43_32b TaxID=1802306 RepID=A0A1G2MKE0_9BACT|nr:MAG: hypothetical protein A2743_01955 [Candidatus Taylorbacteria bacterium RIFCSPHIGHO2_01_FULL_43_47]OHA24308.1 MAG: hypothetical protein A3C72_03485 [Candidatus Taylorbacteria bacterium RIFCSPHIGHO2_02_FULL_43_32b]OHA31316.1 MAG: hypothetical protein A3B08_02575 [Candidatus Taylorbacteria bacterium RIFCSPLOWO2_01_FULL_43_44]OHA37843.1 MAG: hypothetical protein A3H57_02080 [Candidatus Taylorbacteria bacterium RIFCSPLOWO2_02_FULL_43_11]
MKEESKDRKDLKVKKGFWRPGLTLNYLSFLEKKTPKNLLPLPGEGITGGAKDAHHASYLFKRFLHADRKVVLGSGKPSSIPFWKTIGAKYSTKELVHFVKRLAFLIKSGVPVLESVHLLRKQTRSSAKGRVLDGIIEDLSNGQFLSDAMAKHTKNFGAFSINVVKVGEMSGSLSINLTYLAEELHKRHVLQRKLLGALVYPAFITIATIGVATMLTVYIFPKVMPIFTSLNVTLPLTTQILLFVSNFLQAYWGTIFLAVLVSIAVFIFAVKKFPKFHYLIASAVLRFPIFGTLVLHYNVANFCRTFSLLLKSGFGVVESCSIIADSTNNPVYKEQCNLIRERIIRGERISKQMEESQRLFPDIVRHMTAIGESSGNLSDTFMYLSEHYESEVDDLVKNLSNSIEPVLMIFMGLVVGFVAVSVITPIYEITQSLQR